MNALPDGIGVEVAVGMHVDHCLRVTHVLAAKSVAALKDDLAEAEADIIALESQNAHSEGDEHAVQETERGLIRAMLLLRLGPVQAAKTFAKAKEAASHIVDTNNHRSHTVYTGRKPIGGVRRVDHVWSAFLQEGESERMLPQRYATRREAMHAVMSNSSM